VRSRRRIVGVADDPVVPLLLSHPRTMRHMSEALDQRGSRQVGVHGRTVPVRGATGCLSAQRSGSSP
jgi:hypothetical protein